MQQMGIETIPLQAPLRVFALDGWNLPQITHQTRPIQLPISGSHTEFISFYVFPTAKSVMILGFEWLHLHKSIINWSNRHIDSWSVNCHSCCLRTAVLQGAQPAKETKNNNKRNNKTKPKTNKVPMLYYISILDLWANQTGIGVSHLSHLSSHVFYIIKNTPTWLKRSSTLANWVEMLKAAYIEYIGP